MPRPGYADLRMALTCQVMTAAKPSSPPSNQALVAASSRPVSGSV